MAGGAAGTAVKWTTTGVSGTGQAVNVAVNAQSIGAAVGAMVGVANAILQNLALMKSGSPDGTDTPRKKNSKGKEYPEVTDPRTGKEIPFPENELEQFTMEQTSALRQQDYRKIYRDAWKEWNANLADSLPEPDWHLVQIHHIQPLKWGGTNTFENMVHLTPSEHVKFTSWWAGYP